MSTNVIYCNLSFFVGSSTKKDNLIHVSTQLGWINSNYRLSRTVDSRTCTTVTIRICPLFFIKDVESIKKRISIKLGINWLNYQSKVKQEVTIIYLIYSNCLLAISLIITSLCSSLIFSKLQGEDTNSLTMLLTFVFHVSRVQTKITAICFSLHTVYNMCQA